MRKLVLLRHGESLWNEENLFTGWTDVELSDKGIEEAKKAALLLKNAGFVFDAAFTSVLKRAIRTLWIVLDEMDLMWIPVYRSWRLNERHYGALQGLNKADTAHQYGDEQVFIWRRSYDIRPPALEKGDSRFPGHDRKYKDLSPDELPMTESLKDTYERLLPCWDEMIVPMIKMNECVLISAHHNSVRAIVKYLESISDNEIMDITIPTGAPLVYEFDASLNPIDSYLIGSGGSKRERFNPHFRSS